MSTNLTDLSTDVSLSVETLDWSQTKEINNLYLNNKQWNNKKLISIFVPPILISIGCGIPIPRRRIPDGTEPLFIW